MATIAVLGTMDTKGKEHEFLAARIRDNGHDALLIDVGTGGPPQVNADVPRENVAEAGGIDLPALMARGDRGECVSAMAEAAPKLLLAMYREKRIDGVVSLGGGGGTAIASAAMRALPIGFPKLIVSTMASGNTAHYVGTKDITMMPSIVDVAGLNRISKTIFRRAAGAICGMIDVVADTNDDRPIVVASMFGNTTQCVDIAKQAIEKAGYEVLVFHATGSGGLAMESLVESGMVAGVLDITTTEWADELVGGVLAAGRGRLDAAGKASVPAIVVPGCLDMVNFGERDSIPELFVGRNLYVHNPQVTLMRTTPAECETLGRILAEKINAYTAPVSVLIPRRAISVISAEGGPFYDPEADDALFSALTNNLRDDIEVLSLDHAINDPAFATACAESLLKNMAEMAIARPAANSRNGC